MTRKRTTTTSRGNREIPKIGARVMSKSSRATITLRRNVVEE